jgi:hypothetical protein
MAPAVLAVDRWLAERPPTSDLADVLVCVWRGDLGQAELPLPDERLDLVWVDDGSLWLSGPETTAVGVGFRPGVGPPMLGLAASAVRDARVRLDELWGIARPASWPSASPPTPMTVGGHGSWSAPCVGWRRRPGRSTRSPSGSRPG